MTRTIALVTAARAKGVELPGEWFVVLCPSCAETYAIYGDKSVRAAKSCQALCIMDRHDSDTKDYIYTGPDLTLPENLHHAFRFADAIEGEPVSIKWCKPFRQEPHFCVDIKRRVRTAPERHLALVAACEAALGIQHRKENAA